MKRLLLGTLAVLATAPVAAQQVPNASPDISVSGRDRFYTSDQFSNTVSVINPATNTLLGVIKLGDLTPANLSPLYKGQLLVHGMGFDRLELIDVHRHRDERSEAYDLRWPLTT